MSALASFLHDVLFDGRMALDAPPEEADDAAALAVLRRAYDAYCLGIAGPLLPLDEPIALAAARLLERAAWYFLNPLVLIESPATLLRLPRAPTHPEEHLSADLVLRFLPTLHRRARALMPNDVLAQTLERTLREWPLSGVLADIAEPPLTRADFGHHAGVNFLYAERLAEHERPGWFPLGRGIQYVELVWQQLGRDVSVLPALQATAAQIGGQSE